MLIKNNKQRESRECEKVVFFINLFIYKVNNIMSLWSACEKCMLCECKITTLIRTKLIFTIKMSLQIGICTNEPKMNWRIVSCLRREQTIIVQRRNIVCAIRKMWKGVWLCFDNPMTRLWGTFPMDAYLLQISIDCSWGNIYYAWNLGNANCIIVLNHHFNFPLPFA